MISDTENYLLTVKMSKRLTLMKNAELKKKKQAKALKLLETCKCHLGPMTPNCLVRLQYLIEKEILSEISYLRVTIAPDIRQK